MTDSSSFEAFMKKVLCVEKGLIYPSLSDAARILKVHRQGISQVCRGVQKKTGKLTFRYATLEDLNTFPLWAEGVEETDIPY